MAIVVTQSNFQHGSGLGFTAVAGRIVLCALGIRNWNVTWNSGGGWSLLAKWDNNTNGSEPNVFIFGKVAAGGETAVGGSFNNDAARATSSIEITGATLTGIPAGSGARTPNGFGASLATPDQTPPAGSSCIVVGASSGKFPVNAPGGAWSCPGIGIANTNQWPWTGLFYQIVTSASGAYSAPATATGTEWGAMASTYLPANVVPGIKARALII